MIYVGKICLRVTSRPGNLHNNGMDILELINKVPGITYYDIDKLKVTCLLVISLITTFK
jgi:hypothetical protein